MASNRETRDAKGQALYSFNLDKKDREYLAKTFAKSSDGVRIGIELVRGLNHNGITKHFLQDPMVDYSDLLVELAYIRAQSERELRKLFDQRQLDFILSCIKGSAGTAEIRTNRKALIGLIEDAMELQSVQDAFTDVNVPLVMKRLKNLCAAHVNTLFTLSLMLSQEQEKEAK